MKAKKYVRYKENAGRYASSKIKEGIVKSISMLKLKAGNKKVESSQLRSYAN
jgi:hypothetical protein